MALSSVFFTCLAMRRLEKVRSAMARLAGRLRMDPATRFSLRGLTRMLRAIASAWLSARPRSAFGLLILAPLRFLVGRVTREGARRREFTKLMANHILVHLHGEKLLPVVNAEGQPHELRQNRRAARPDLDDLVAARSPR